MMKVTIPGGMLECLTAGSPEGGNPSLVLLHGIQGTASVWQPVLPGVSDDRFTIAPQMRGRAGSYSPDDIDAYSLNAFSRDLRVVLDKLAGPVVLVGWSMGCLVALDYVCRFGSKGLSGLALVSGTPCLATTGGKDAVWFHGDTPEAVLGNAADRARRLQLRDVATNTAVAGSWLSAKAADYRHLLPEIDLPTLILHGMDDPECPVAHAEYMARNIPGAQSRLWSGCAHVPMLHDPDRFVFELKNFLRDCTIIHAYRQAILPP